VYYNGVCTPTVPASPAAWVIVYDYLSSKCAGTPFVQEGFETNVCINTYKDGSTAATGSIKYVVSSCSPTFTGTVNFYTLPGCTGALSQFPVSEVDACIVSPRLDSYGPALSYRTYACSNSPTSPLAVGSAQGVNGVAVTTSFGPKGLCEFGAYSQYIWSPTDVCLNSTQSGVKSSYMITSCGLSTSTTTEYVDDHCGLADFSATAVTYCSTDANAYYNEDLQAYTNTVCTGPQTANPVPPAPNAAINNSSSKGYSSGSIIAAIVVCLLLGVVGGYLVVHYVMPKASRYQDKMIA